MKFVKYCKFISTSCMIKLARSTEQNSLHGHSLHHATKSSMIIIQNLFKIYSFWTFIKLTFFCNFFSASACKEWFERFIFSVSRKYFGWSDSLKGFSFIVIRFSLIFNNIYIKASYMIAFLWNHLNIFVVK